MSIRRFTSTTLVGLIAFVATALFATAAQAAARHEFLSTLVTEIPAVGPHGEAVASSGRLGEPDAMTVDSGELYISELAAGNSVSRLDTFDASSGAFTFQFPPIEEPIYDFRQSIAVGRGTGETQVYNVGDEHVAEVRQGIVAVYSSGVLQAKWTGADTPSKGFGCFECDGSSAGVATDDSTSLSDWAAGDVYVADPEHKVVDVFKPKANGGEEYVTQLTGPEPAVPFSHPHHVAVDQLNGDLAVVDGREIDLFEPTAFEKYDLIKRITGTPSEAFGEIRAIAIDGGSSAGGGEIYVANSSTGTVDQFDSSGNYLGQLTETPAGPLERPQAGVRLDSVAIDPATHDVYVGAQAGVGGNAGGVVYLFGPDLVVPDVAVEPASGVTPRAATLDGTVNPDGIGPAKCEFEWGASPSLGKLAPCSAEVAQGVSPVPVHAVLSGLLSDTTYYYRLRATNVNGTNISLTEAQFTTSGPNIAEESTADIAATSATLGAIINPNNAPTSYYFQYGTSAEYGASVPLPPGVALGSGGTDSEVAQHLQGLAAGTIYHYRVVAITELAPGDFEAFDGEDGTFTTQPAGSGFVLPDGRQWEMVSPPDKRGAPIRSLGFGVTQASVNGDAISYLMDAPPEAEPQGYAEGAQVLARRGADGWESEDIASHHGKGPTGGTVGYGFEYRFFSEDLSLGVMQQWGTFDPSLSPEASEITPFLRRGYLNGDVEDPCVESCYRPLVTGAPGYANVPPGTIIDLTRAFGEHKCLVGPVCGPQFVGATPDMSHVVLDSEVSPLTPGGESGLYEWTDGKLTFVGNSATLGNEYSARHAISNDGTRVIFTTGGSSGQGQLFLRDTESGEAVQLDAPQGGSGFGPPNATFQVASSDGSKVFFTDSQPLTKDALGTDLYECEVTVSAGKPQCALADLTPTGSETESAGVQGALLGASEDGSYVYFVATGVLASGAVGGGDNLYVRHAGATKLVAVLAAGDEAWSIYPPDQTARVSPNGRWLAFMSDQDLTGYVTRDAISGKPDAEVYLYDASTGRLVCASCNPTGARPVGFELGGENRVVDFSGQPPEAWIAASIPGWSQYELSRGRYQSRYLSDSGRLFFNSNDALVPQDVNGAEDVYQYEPPGVGDCSTSSLTFGQSSGGCVGLISSGTSAEESALLDASGSGGDVFFLTAAKLSPRDVDTSLDVYDAHECTGSVPCFPTPASAPPPCNTGDACKAAPTPQPTIFGTPSSATFSGAGNIVPETSKLAVQSRGLTKAQKLARALKACRRKKGRARAVCKRSARARYAKAPRAANNARTKGGKG